MNPYPGSNSVLCLDNASTHHRGRVQALCDRRGVVLEYLAPYSPDFNPEEKAFSVLKSKLRKRRTMDTALDPIEAIHQIVWEVMNEDLMRKLYKASGYF